jgi:anthranilate synthase component II
VRLLVIDNYDSFVYNLVQYFGMLGVSAQVYRNDALTVEDVGSLEPEAILISPGPGNPAQAGVSVDVIRRYAGEIPILGVCLGHQAIGHAFGGRIRRAVAPMHGKLSQVHHAGAGLFAGLEQPLEVVRYHSLVIDQATRPDCLEVTASSPDGEIMGVRHRALPALVGVQFHPESVFTRQGLQLLQNFMNIAQAFHLQGVRERSCNG